MSDLLRRVRPREQEPRPVLSVVVPFFDPGPRLHRCMDSLAEQTLAGMEVVLVDDGSTDGSAESARKFAASHDGFRLVTRPHTGVGPARDAGVQEARGEFLAFCDSDDEVPAGAYERLVGALRQSGSDIAVGAVTLEKNGVHRQPAWSRRSNPARRLGVRLDDVPEVVANLMPGTRVFRRSFWDEHELGFGEDDHREVVTMVRALLAADRIDVLAGVTYRWGWPEHGSSLLQRDLREVERVRCRMAHLHEAGGLVLAGAPPAVQRRFFTDLLHTEIPELVRAAVCRDDEYWSSLRTEMQRLMSQIPADDLAQVAVGDRLLAWLCASAERHVAEDFLEHAFESPDGFAFRLVDDGPHLDVAALDGLVLDPALTRVAEVDMPYRTRLTGLRWSSPGVLRLEGAAFVEYLPSVEDRRVTVVLRGRPGGPEVEVTATPVDDETVNRWASRAHEDHSRAAFTCEVDLTAASRAHPAVRTWTVTVRLDARGHRWEAPFESRRGTGSAGLLETSVRDGVAATPTWSPGAGLGVRVEPGPSDATFRSLTPASPDSLPSVTAIDAATDVVRLHYVAEQPYELALVGPRSRTAWTVPEQQEGGYVAQLDLLVDEWGAGRASLPSDDYAVVARAGEGDELPVLLDRALWRELPLLVDGGTHLVHPRAVDDGRLELGLAPGEQRDGVGSYRRRELRDEVYPAARHRPLLDVALFETFSGRGAGDNPGPLCEEMMRRDAGLESVFSVQDRSVLVPDGARAVIRFSPEWFELLGRARFLVTNAPLPPFFRKREGQTFLNTWHGTTIKRLGHDREYVDFALWHHRRQLLAARHDWDFMLSQSPYCTRTLTSAFRYEGRMLESGYPRNDVLVSPQADEVRWRTRERLGISPASRVVLYAPTWRETRRAGRVFDKVIYLDTDEVVRQVPDSVVLVRGHYQSFRAADVRNPDPRILDVTRYPDISDLYLAADALVTDYSSVFFDFALTDKPMFFLAPDLDHYRDVSRGLYVDYHSIVPGPVCVTTEEVVAGLLGADDHVEVRSRFRREYTPWDDGHAAQRVVDVLLA